MNFSYRTRRFLGRLLRGILVLALVALAVLACWLLWLQRFIQYTPDGVRLDFNLSQTFPSGQEAQPIKPGPSVPIYYDRENTEATLPSDEPTLKKISGFYVTTDQLLEDLNGILEKIRALPEGTAVLLDVKGGWGYFYYPTGVGTATSTSFDMAVMEEFFATVNSLGLHTIARMSAFRDYEFGRNNTASGLWAPGGYLWADQDSCYWLDPTKDAVMTYLIQICKELQGMGFDEVLFRDFRFPPTQDIRFEGDRNAALQQAAKTLVTACANDSFTVSFMVEGGALFSIPDANCRLYLENIAAVDVAEINGIYNVPNPEKQLLFFTGSGDTRYEVSCVLRPIDMAY